MIFAASDCKHDLSDQGFAGRCQHADCVHISAAYLLAVSSDLDFCYSIGAFVQRTLHVFEIRVRTPLFEIAFRLKAASPKACLSNGDSRFCIA